MTERQQAILAAIIEQYAEIAAPVGSVTLAKLFGVSSATIRSEMAKLEEMGVTQKVKYGRNRLQEELAELAREGFGKYRVVLVGDERSHEACSVLVGRVFSIDGAGW